MLEVDLEEAKVLGLVIFRGLESEKFGVDHGDDGQGESAVGQVGTASAAVVGDLGAEEVLVGDELGVGGRLDGGHHEPVFGTDFLLLALFLLHLGDFVLNLVQI